MDNGLRRALLGDAIFETICALIFILGAGVLVTWTGWQIQVGFVLVGVILAAAAALLYWMARQQKINAALARAVIFLNAFFGAGGFLVLVIFWASLTDGARWLIGSIALLVGVFAALEYAGLRGLDAQDV